MQDEGKKVLWWLIMMLTGISSGAGSSYITQLNQINSLATKIEVLSTKVETLSRHFEERKP